MMNSTLFPEEVLDQAPLIYRYMHVFPAAGVKELYLTKRFSDSRAHRSRDTYLCYPPEKPVSNLSFKLMTAKK